MKKIRITTFHKAQNYGASLQCYALQQTCKKICGDVKILNYINETIEKPYRIIRIEKFNEGIKKIIKSILSSILFFNKNLRRNREFNKFFEEKFIMTEELKKEEIINNNKFSDCIFITGSDQVWNPEITKGLDDIYTLNFKFNPKRKISYAASIGSSEIQEKYREEYLEKLVCIDNISVREEDGKKAISKILKEEKNIEVVLDPTLLLKKEEWIEEILPIDNSEKVKYIFSYCVNDNEEYRKILRYLSKNENLKIIEFDKISKEKNVLKNLYSVGPIEFLRYLYNAEFVITTSFHATVFSIIFNKKFFVIPHKKTGSRMLNLLEKLDITDRAVVTEEEFKKIDYHKECDWNKLEEKLELERKKSIDWLNNAINS